MSFEKIGGLIISIILSLISLLVLVLGIAYLSFPVIISGASLLSITGLMTALTIKNFIEKQ